jgi:hypothetical protein
MAWFWFFLPAVIFFTTAIGIGIWHAKRNNADGVIANWRSLRITHTELIEGYLQNARRHSLKGLKARVEDSGTRHKDHRIHVIVEGPTTAVVRTAKASSAWTSDKEARQFAANLNMLSRQLS